MLPSFKKDFLNYEERLSEYLLLKICHHVNIICNRLSESDFICLRASSVLILFIPLFLKIWLIKNKIEKSSDNNWEKLVKKIFGQGMNDYDIFKINSLDPLCIWSKG